MGGALRALAVSRAFWIILAVVALPLHVWWASASHHGSDLARCGALWAVFGAAMLARPIIRLRFDEWFGSTQGLNGGEYADARDPAAVAEQERVERQALADARADAQTQQILGPFLIVAGTLLWGYGDVLWDRLFVP